MAAPSVTAAPPRRSRFLKYVIGFLVALVVIYVAACAYIYFTQDRETFPALPEYDKVTPTNVGIPFEDLRIPVNGSEQIHAWWVPGTASSSNSSNRVLLLFHGNGERLEDNITGLLRSKSGLGPIPDLGVNQLDLISLHRGGFNVLAIDYRGYGSSSPGIPNEKRVYEDARAAFGYLTIKRGVPSRDVILVGHSIGTGPATEMAKEHPDAGGLILVSPFASLPDMIRLTPEYRFTRVFPIKFLLHNQFDNLSKIDSVHIPLLIAVGTSDDVTIPDMAQALYQRANEPKRLYLSPGAGHNNIWETEGLQSQIGSSFRRSTESATLAKGLVNALRGNLRPST